MEPSVSMRIDCTAGRPRSTFLSNTVTTFVEKSLYDVQWHGITSAVPSFGWRIEPQSRRQRHFAAREQREGITHGVDGLRIGSAR